MYAPIRRDLYMDSPVFKFLSKATNSEFFDLNHSQYLVKKDGTSATNVLGKELPDVSALCDGENVD